jgi:two-component system, NtrC family, sensor kinase
MSKVKEKRIRNINLISIFLVLIVFVFVVIMLSISRNIDDFQIIEKDIQHKLLEDKKNEIKYKIDSVNILIEQLNQNNIQKSQQIVKDYVKQLNKNKNHIIQISEFTKQSSYDNEFNVKSEYFKYDRYFDVKLQRDIDTVEYQVLNKTWNWVISLKMNNNIVHKEIQKWKVLLDTLIEDNIYVHLALLFFFTIALLLVVYIINKLSQQTLRKCRENIKIKEKNLKKTINILEQRIDDEVNKYQNQNKTVQKQSKMLALAEMLGNISHQWREPLNAISKSIKKIKSENKNESMDNKIESLELDSINNSAIYLSRTIDDFREFLRADVLKIDFVVNDIVEKALAINDAMIKNHNITVVKNLDEDVSIYNLSYGLLQALVNIIHNTKDVLRHSDSKDKFIFVSTANKDNAIELTITDTGGGISEDIIGKIFEPYFTTKQKTHGTGLGLHMAHNIIKQNMNGMIVATTKKFKYNDEDYIGASFTIVLDRTEKK